MKRILLSIFLLLSPLHVSPEEQAAAAMYYAAFGSHVRLAFTEILTKEGRYGEPGDLAFEAMIDHIVGGMTRCHAESMEFFDSKHVQKAYDAVAKGGTYADAKMAFDISLAADSAAGGPEEEAVKEAVINSVEQGQRCVADVMK